MCGVNHYPYDIYGWAGGGSCEQPVVSGDRFVVLNIGFQISLGLASSHPAVHHHTQHILRGYLNAGNTSYKVTIQSTVSTTTGGLLGIFTGLCES